MSEPETPDEVQWPDPAEDPAEEPAETLEDDGTPGTGTPHDPDPDDDQEAEDGPEADSDPVA